MKRTQPGLTGTGNETAVNPPLTIQSEHPPIISTHRSNLCLQTERINHLTVMPQVEEEQSDDGWRSGLNLSTLRHHMDCTSATTPQSDGDYSSWGWRQQTILTEQRSEILKEMFEGEDVNGRISKWARFNRTSGVNRWMRKGQGRKKKGCETIKLRKWSDNFCTQVLSQTSHVCVFFFPFTIQQTCTCLEQL